MAAYPGAVYSPRTKENKPGIEYDAAKAKIGYAEDVTKLDDEVVAIQTELGLNPKGVFASVKARLEALVPYTGAVSDVNLGTHNIETIGMGIFGEGGIKVADSGYHLTIRALESALDEDEAIDLSVGGAPPHEILVTGQAAINQNTRTTATPIFAGLITPAINKNTAQDLKLFEDLNIDNAADGQAFYVYRNAPEGKEYLEIRVNKTRYAMLNSPRGWSFNKAGSLRVQITDTINFYRWMQLRSDTYGIKFGIGVGGLGDAGIHYNGTNLIINPKIIGTGKAIIEGAIASATLTFAVQGPTDDLDVSGVNTVFINAGANPVTIGGLVGGVDGQVLQIAIINGANAVTLEHAEGGGNQDIFLHVGADETLDGEYGGWTLVCYNGVDWYDVSHARHI